MVQRRGSGAREEGTRGSKITTPTPNTQHQKDLAALQANNVLQWQNQACLTDSRSCGGSLRDFAFSHLFRNPTPPDALCRRGRANSGQVVSFLRLACCRAAPSWSAHWRRALPSPLTGDTRVVSTAKLRAVEQKKSVSHNLNLPVVDPP